MALVWIGIVGRAPAEIAAGVEGSRAAAAAYVALVCLRLFVIAFAIQALLLRFAGWTPLGFVRALTAAADRQEASGADALADRDDPARGRPRAHRADRGRDHHARAVLAQPAQRLDAGADRVAHGGDDRDRPHCATSGRSRARWRGSTACSRAPAPRVGGGRCWLDRARPARARSPRWDCADGASSSRDRTFPAAAPR